ncbi:MAG TPA: carboxypeptidase regulatory-like domain-containing protein [Bryobacteraceae bacterium]|jgi:hypothetical protein|nr:carboxypeptidase regulatory-like domain-containing protein [Bryobacteraceae bacterium]
MSRLKKALLAVGIAVLIAAAIAGWLLFKTHPVVLAQPTLLTGVTLIEDKDPKNQLPVADADVSATRGTEIVRTKSDSTGLWRLTLPPETNNSQRPPSPIRLSFKHSGYQPVDIAVYGSDKIFIARLTPIAQLVNAASRQSDVLIANVKVRYSEKASYTSDTGSIVNQLEVPNQGGYPCNGHTPCSPDGKWKASERSFTIDAQGNELRRTRLSCIAGPCPFSKITSQELVDQGRTLKITILNWSDTVTYLLEAEVARTVLSDMIRQSYPALFGDSMTFTLPKTAEGPSIEAELGRQDIVFPLGPDLIVSWANCTEKPGQNDSKLFRCDLKPGYRFVGQ